METSLEIRNRYIANQSKPTSSEETQAKENQVGIWHKKIVEESAEEDRISGIDTKNDDIIKTYLLGTGAAFVSSLVGGFTTYLVSSLIEDYQGSLVSHKPESQALYPMLIGAAISGVVTVTLACRKISKLENEKSYYKRFDKEIVAVPQMLKNRQEIIHFLKLFGAKKVSDNYDDNTTMLIINDNVEKKQIQTKQNKGISVLTVTQMNQIIDDFTEIDDESD